MADGSSAAPAAPETAAVIAAAAPPATPAATPPAPAAASPSPAAAVEAPAPSASPAAPAASTETPVETPNPAEAPKEAATAEQTILGSKEAPKPPAEAKPTEAEKPAEVKPEEGGQSEEPAPLPTYERFTFPEGATVRDEIVTEFNGVLGEFERTTKADHAAVQALGQKLVDFHAARVRDVAEAIQNASKEAFNNQRKEWRDNFLADPEIGGNRFQTTVDAAMDFIRTHGGSDEQQAEIRDLMDKSNLGNHPAMIRLFANAGRAMSEGRPLAAKSPPPQPKSKTQTLYGRSSR